MANLLIVDDEQGIRQLLTLVFARAGHELLPDVAVVMMTAFATVDTAREAFKLGADDFIQKPFDVDDLKLIVERALEVRDLKQELEGFKKTQSERGRLD